MTDQLDIFYNTVPLKGNDLRQARSRAAKQDDMTLKVFQSAPHPLTPCDVHSILVMGFINPATPLTSIRRSITSLTKAGKLIKSDTKRKGMFGVLNNTWEINKSCRQ